MDKNRKMDVEKDETDILVHRLPSLVMRPVHRNYGLWVFRSGRGGCSPGHPLSWFRENPRRFEFFGISHMTAGKGIFWRPDAPVEEIHPGQCVVVTPGTIHHYGGVEGASYTEDTVNFTGELAVMMQRSGVIRDGVYDLGYRDRTCAGAVRPFTDQCELRFAETADGALQPARRPDSSGTLSAGK